MATTFPDRSEAGKQLAEALVAYKDRKDVIVLALPRGGVPVGVEIAKALDVPMDLMLVRKLGVPGEEELAMGAVAMGGVCFLNDDVMRQFQISQSGLDEVTERERHELLRRNALYRGGRAAPQLKGQTVILVDDGIATGADMRAAVRAAKQLEAKRIVVAVPVASDSATAILKREADEMISLLVPSVFFGVGAFYEDFAQMEDDEVIALMATVRQ